MTTKTEFKLSNDRLIRLTSIDQWNTYGGLIEGVPTTEMNARIVQQAMSEAREKKHFEPHLLQPQETPIKLGREYPFGTPASIPAVSCIACFECFDPVRSDRHHGSALQLVWFQSEFAFPIETEIIESILQLPWEMLATDFLY